MAAICKQANKEIGGIKEELMSNYYRITAYYPDEDVTMILDAYGKYDELWQFSSELVGYGLKILEVCDLERIADTDITPIPAPLPEKVGLRALEKGKLSSTESENGILVAVGGKHYTIKASA